MFKLNQAKFGVYYSSKTFLEILLKTNVKYDLFAGTDQVIPVGPISSYLAFLAPLQSLKLPFCQKKVSGEICVGLVQLKEAH